MTSEAAPPAPGANGDSAIAARVLRRPVDEELKASFMDYAMSVIVSRALPDARDGLKPVHRRILHGMNELGSGSDKPPKKSARVVGEVLGKYHPHGDVAIYDALVRMAQTFSLRYPLVDGQGNFGSVDGDAAAHMRYTEARLSKLAEEMLADIDKETVDWTDNFDATLQEPVVLPSKLPNLLVNGSSGIAVGMATNMAPHNLGEVVDALLHLIDHPEASLGDLLRHVKGPDFPTGGLVLGRAGLVEAYGTGRGKIVVRGRVTTEKFGKDRQALIITELPYQVNKAALLVNMADQVKDKTIDGISDLRDESDRDGMRVVIELKRDANADVVVNQLYAHTQLQATFGVQNLALVKNRPLTLSLKRLMEEFRDHRATVVTRRTQFELKKAEERAHILEGLLVALAHIEEVIQLIRTSKSAEEAKARLVSRFALTEIQAKAVLDTRLARLAQLEVEEVKTEHAELLRRILRYKEILASRLEILNIVKAELVELKRAYPSPRRTEIVEMEAEEVLEEHLISEHEAVVTITNAGYVKRLPLATYRSQGRGGRGVIGTETKDEDFVTDLLVTSSHNLLMFFTNRGQAHWLKVYEIPEAGRYNRGKAIVNLLQGLQAGERITAMIPVPEFRDDRFVFFATRRGVVKRTVLSDFKNVRAGGIRALTLDEGDELIGVGLTHGKNDVVLARASGKAARFHEDEVRPMGRTATGVWGVSLDDTDEVVSLALVEGEQGDLLTIKANGRGKRTRVSDYPVKHRATQGVITILTEETVDGQAVTSPVVGMLFARPGEHVMVVTERGIVIRVPVDTIPQKGRAAQGNWIIRPEAGDRVVAMERVAPEIEEMPAPPAGALS